MTSINSERDITVLIGKFNRKPVVDALIFVFGVIVKQIHESDIEQPKAFDEVDEFIRLISEAEYVPWKEYDTQAALELRSSIIDHCLRGPDAYSGSFWQIFARTVSLLFSTWERSPRNVSVADYIFMEMTNLSKLCNLLNGLSKYKPEGHAVVSNLMMDRLHGKI